MGRSLEEATTQVRTGHPRTQSQSLKQSLSQGSLNRPHMALYGEAGLLCRGKAKERREVLTCAVVGGAPGEPISHLHLHTAAQRGAQRRGQGLLGARLLQQLRQRPGGGGGEAALVSCLPLDVCEARPRPTHTGQLCQPLRAPLAS